MFNAHALFSFYLRSSYKQPPVAAPSLQQPAKSSMPSTLKRFWSQVITPGTPFTLTLTPEYSLALSAAALGPRAEKDGVPAKSARRLQRKSDDALFFPFSGVGY